MKRKAKIENLYYKKDGVVFNFQFQTTNQKTGDLIQNFMIPEAWIETTGKVRELDDNAICGDCDHGHTRGKGDCYVTKANSLRGLQSKLSSLRRMGLDNIPYLSDELEADLLDAIEGRGVRFGSYGEPVLLGEELVKKISDRAKFWTGYTHQWHKNPWAKKYFMASVETTLVDKAAQSMGWRTFYAGEPTEGNHVTCPASKEAGYKTTCDQCKLCMGTTSKAKSVKIKIH
jgi:hypothetical protein